MQLIDFADGAGDGPISRVVNLVMNSPLFPVMKIMARGMIKRRAEQKDVPWSKRYEELKSSEVC